MPSADDIFRQFEIELDAGHEPIFHGDELITGKLRIELKRPMTIQAIKLQFKGRAACIKRDSSKGAEVEKVSKKIDVYNFSVHFIAYISLDLRLLILEFFMI